MSYAAHHFTLAHRPSSMAINPTKWRLLVRASREMKTARSSAKEASTISKKVGLSDDPGVRSVSMTSTKPPTNCLSLSGAWVELSGASASKDMTNKQYVYGTR